MRAEEKCNRCEQLGANGLTDYPCKRVPSRSCPFFIKISEKKYKRIVAERVKRLKESEELRKKMLEDENIVQEVKQQTNEFYERRTDL